VFFIIPQPNKNREDLGFTRSLSANPPRHSKNKLIPETRQRSSRTKQQAAKEDPEAVKKGDAKNSRATSDGAFFSRHYVSPNRSPHISSGSAFYSNIVVQQASTLSAKATGRLPATPWQADCQITRAKTD